MAVKALLAYFLGIGILFGDTTFSPINVGSVSQTVVSGMESNGVVSVVESYISESNARFSNAVLSVGLNIDTNSIAIMNEIAESFGGFPVGGTATTVGGLLLALAAAVAWLKRNKIGQEDVVPELTEGTKVATIGGKDIYAPQGGSSEPIDSSIFILTEGYYSQDIDKFYLDSEKTVLIEPNKTEVYIDLISGLLYVWNGASYIESPISSIFMIRDKIFVPKRDATQAINNMHKILRDGFVLPDAEQSDAATEVQSPRAEAPVDTISPTRNVISIKGVPGGVDSSIFIPVTGYYDEDSGIFYEDSEKSIPITPTSTKIYLDSVSGFIYTYSENMYKMSDVASNIMVDRHANEISPYIDQTNSNLESIINGSFES